MWKGSESIIIDKLSIWTIISDFAATRAPLESAWVALTAVSSESSGEMTEAGLFKGITDLEGHFEISSVPAGKYQLRAGMAGYLSEYCRLEGGPPKATLKCSVA